ncbi:MAG: ATP-binding domain-containing protein, partial [Oscillospiraceae bacterium]|nr:ATP-binding domain-containing protein [Oscillospiraceae bacterium]
RRGECGTAALNRALQGALNPRAAGKKECIVNGALFREGDRVIQTRNNYDVTWQRADGTAGLGIFNGDVGKIVQIEAGGELVTVAFDDRTALYSGEMLVELELAYAITVHKAQGSEYRGVIFVCAPVAPGLMVRGVLYTGITRARELLVAVGDDGVIEKMTKNDRQQRRYSGLRRRLMEEV